MQANILIGGKQVGLLFGYTCYKAFVLGSFNNNELFWVKDEDESKAGITNTGLSALFDAAHLDYCLDKRKEKVLSFNDFSKFVDDKMTAEGGPKELADLYTIFLDTAEVKEVIEKDQQKKSQQQNGASQISPN